MEGALYDQLQLEYAQMIVARTTDDWYGALTNSKFPFHILRQTEFGLALHKPLIQCDTKLQKSA